MTPKSLLRHPEAKSNFAEMVEGNFESEIYVKSNKDMVPALR